MIYEYMTHTARYVCNSLSISYEYFYNPIIAFYIFVSLIFIAWSNAKQLPVLHNSLFIKSIQIYLYIFLNIF